MTILKVFNVNHGDAMLFQPDGVFQDVPLLIDTGAKTYNIHQKIYNKQFDIMITHADGDHMNGLNDLLKHELQNIQNIYLPLYQPEINRIFFNLRNIGSENTNVIQNAENLIHKHKNKIVFVYDGWHNYNKNPSLCNLAKCSNSEILNPPRSNFDALNNDPEFSEYSFERALIDVENEDMFKDGVFDKFNFKNYTPEKFHEQNEELIDARREYFKYVIRLIGYTIFKEKWINKSANKLFTLESNNVSIILRYQQKNRFSILFTGDAGDKILKNLIKQNKLGQTDILKVPHHGGADSIGKKILDTIAPKYAILSHNSRGFGKGSVPNAISVNELQSRAIAILATNTVTNLTLTTSINKILGIYKLNAVNRYDDIEFIQ